MKNKLLFVLFVLLFSCKSGLSKESHTPSKEMKEFVLFDIPKAGIEFPIGTDDKGDGKKDAYGKLIKSDVIFSSFEIGIHEVSYELWKEVYEWAIKNGYQFLNAGRQGSGGSPQIKGKENHLPSPIDESKRGQPVVYISWYDVVCWCNAYSEKMGKNPLYYFESSIFKDARSTFIENGEKINCGDRIECKTDRDGYRLATSKEWEFAARCPSKESFENSIPFIQKDGSIYYFLKGNSISSAFYPYANIEVLEATNSRLHEDIKKENDLYAVYDNFWNGKTWKKKGVKNTETIASKCSNRLGLYDMSGNVAEWVFDWANEGKHRIYRGGAYYNLSRDLQVGAKDEDSPSYAYYGLGFRLAKNVD
jgi:conserved domain protein